MPSERVQRQIDRLLDDAEAALASGAWGAVAEKSRAVLAIDEGNEDAAAYLKMAEANLGGAGASAAPAAAASAPSAPAAVASGPETFSNGRYEVVKFLGEGGRKKVYLARDTLLDRQVAFALIKTEGLDEAARERITREAQTMGRLGNHPNLVSVLDIGEHTDAAGVTFPWMAIELLAGGDVEGLLKKANGPLPVEQTLRLGMEVCRGLEFLESKGVVHRDLKPGNVWLTADGTAKIGDYGLAMSAQNTRLTLQGTMVGTVDYMPPEQALGGEITARSDLYSLGAMLYELVTGKPPFSGERIAEVISQHINVVPPPPSERGAQIPRALDELIAELLAKDPAQRPSSAAAVRQRLEAIDPADLPVLFDEDFRLRRARQVFVGRSRELEELRHRFDEAAGGFSRIVMLTGQPGIGKTRLAQELEAHALSRGARVLWGRSPEGGGAPEYWLFSQSLRRFLDELDETTARRLLGEDAPQLARIAPEIRERLRTPEAADTSDFPLHEAVRAFLHSLAEERPLLLILDDLHWADRGSLALLQHASRELATAKALILGTYRDTELSRTHPLSQALATLNREPNFFRINVRGLDRQQVSDYIERSAGFEPTREQLDAFMRETDGNPFFLSEIVAGMLEHGTLDDRTYELEIPDGVREACARRVNALSEDAVELLKLAAVCGYDFEFTDLAAFSDFDDDRQLTLIEEALAERVIAEGQRAGSYRFVYQPMQRVLLDELSATRRSRLHGQLGERLEAAYGAQAEQHAAMLARHFSESATLNPAHREKALRYSWAAAQQAERARDFGSARRWLAVCTEMIEGGASTAGLVDDIDLLAASGRVGVLAGAGISAVDLVSRAIDLYLGEGRIRDAAAAALSAKVFWAGPAGNRGTLVDRVIAAARDRDPETEARLTAWRVSSTADTADEAAAASARRYGVEHGLGDVVAGLRQRDAAIAIDRGYASEAVGIALEAADLYSSLDDDVGQWDALRLAAGAAFVAGNLDRAASLWRQLAVNARGAGWLYLQSLAWLRVAEVAFLRRDPELSTMVASVPPSSLLHIERFLVPMQLLHGGDIERAIRRFERASASPDSTNAVNDGQQSALRARLLSLHGDLASAGTELRRAWDVLLAPGNMRLAATVATYADAAPVAIGDRELLRRLADFGWEPDGHPRAIAGSGGSVDRVRATWALALDRLEEAERLARRGLGWCVRERCPVEEGRCHQLLADVLRRKGETTEARAHLDAASALFQRHGARLYLDQVLDQRDLLKA